MGNVFPAIVVGFGLLLPVALLGRLLFGRPKSRVMLIATAVTALLVIGVTSVSVVGFWHTLGVFWPWVHGAAFVAILIWRVGFGLPAVWWAPGAPREAVMVGLSAVACLVCALQIPVYLRARTYPAPAVSLAPPLRGGDFYVISGGSVGLVNQHNGGGNPFATDITRLQGWGTDAAGFLPADLTRYAAYGTDVIAPCAGEVIAAVDGRPDQKPLHPNGADGDGGNHVVIYCQGFSIRLAHLRPGSLRVAVGQKVAVGDAIGQVGSSGNALQPHLHIDAVVGRFAEARAGSGPGAPRPAAMLIGGRFLVKGDRFGG